MLWRGKRRLTQRQNSQLHTYFYKTFNMSDMATSVLSNGTNVFLLLEGLVLFL